MGVTPNFFFVRAWGVASVRERLARDFRGVVIYGESNDTLASRNLLLAVDYYYC